MPGGTPGWPPQQPVFEAGWSSDTPAHMLRQERSPMATVAGIVVAVLVVALVVIVLV